MNHPPDRLDPRNKPSPWLLIMIAIGVAVLVTLFAAALLFMRDIWTAQPLG